MNVVIFGSCLTSEEPRDIDFTYDGCSYTEAVTVVAKWREENLHRWKIAPVALHGTEGVIVDGTAKIAVRPGQVAQFEQVKGTTRVEVQQLRQGEKWMTQTPYQERSSALYAEQSHRECVERHYRETRYRP